MVGMALSLQERMRQCFLGAGPGARVQLQQALQQVYRLMTLYRVWDVFPQGIQPCWDCAVMRGRLDLHIMTTA